MSNLIPEGAQPVRPPRTKPIKDRSTGAVIGEQTQRVYLLATVPNALVRFPEPDRFKFNDEQVIDGNTIPAHFHGRHRTVDVFLQAGIQPASELAGRVEVKAFMTENHFTAKAEGEKAIRPDSENDYLRVTFVGSADNSEQKVVEIRYGDDGITSDEGFGWTKNGAGVFIGVKPIEKPAEPFNPVMDAAPADPTA